MACNDRQLTQAQREAGYQQMRTAGVVRAPRPFSGEASVENLVDYLNREVYPALKAAREKVNDVYRQVTDNAPSANPLVYYFSTETAAADPTTGRLRLNSATQNAATVVRLSQLNGILRDAGPWLDVISGSVTTPLGTLTLTDAIDPGRFLRWDLTAMVDQGAYWDLTVTFVESSHDNPFVEGQGVVCGFIPGVASSNATVPITGISPIAQSRILGRAEGAGTGVVTPLTPAQVIVIIDQETVTWTGSHTFTGGTVNVNVTGAAGFVAVSDVGIGSTGGGLSLGAGAVGTFIFQSPDVSNGDVVINASSGLALTAGLALGTSAVAAGDVVVEANSDITLTTNSVERLEIQSTGAWQLAGDASREGAVLASRGSGTPPVWQLGSNKNICQWWEDFEFTSPSTLAGIFFAGSSGSWMSSLAGAAGGSTSVVAAESGHPGIVRLTTHTVINTLVTLYRGSSNTTAPVGTQWVRGDQILRFEAVVRPTLTETKGLLIGFAEDVSSVITTGVGQSNLMAFMFDSANALLDVNIQCVTREADGTAVINDSGISMTSIHGTWVTMEIRQTTLGTVEFLINENVVATHTTQVPDAETLNCGFTVVTRAASATALDIDYASFISHPLDRTAG